MNRQLAFVINLKRCIGCDTCVVACKMEHSVPLGQFRLKVYDSHGDFQFEKPTGTYPNLDMYWLPTMCQHCVEAPCIEVCPTRVLWRSDDNGTVVLEKDRCVGCQRCGEVCPYDALSFEGQSGIADKCNMCEHRIQKNAAPMCQVVCPTRAIAFGDINDTSSPTRQLLEQREHKVLNESSAAQPQIFYLSP